MSLQITRDKCYELINLFPYLCRILELMINSD